MRLLAWLVGGFVALVAGMVLLSVVLIVAALSLLATGVAVVLGAARRYRLF